MSNTLRISLFGLAGATAGFLLQGCFTPQPTPECSVTITAAALGLGPYYTKLSPVSGTGACSQLTHFSTGLQRFRTAPSGGAFKVAVKTSLVTDPYLGYIDSANVDPTNDCVNESDCQGDDKASDSCVVNVADGGVELFDGTPVNFEADGGVGVPSADGGVIPIDPANECGPVDDPIARVDPTDPKGKNLIATGDMPQFPTGNFCEVTNLSGGVENYQAEDLTLVDGTMTTLPAITYKVEFTNFKVINSTKVPGTAFTADVKYTEDGCTADYTAVGFWPAISCSNKPSEGDLVESTDCDPNADVDAGRIFGSGINPEFKPKCDTKLKMCVPTVDLATLK